jgi:HK97 family phage major capsid protein
VAPRRPDPLEGEYRKSLTQFAYRANEWLVPAEMASRVIRCIIEADDLSSFVSHERISGPAITFPIDNSFVGASRAWSCADSCYAPPAPQDFQDGFGQITVRAEELRRSICLGRSLLANAAFDLERYVLSRVEAGFRGLVGDDFLLGDDEIRLTSAERLGPCYSLWRRRSLPTRPEPRRS